MEKEFGSFDKVFKIDPEELKRESERIEANKTPDEKEKDRFAKDWSPEALEEKNKQVDEVIEKIVQENKDYLDGKGEYTNDVDNPEQYSFEDKTYELTGGHLNEQSMRFTNEARKRLTAKIDALLEKK